MSTMDTVILTGFHWMAYILGALLVLYVFTHVAWRLLEAIYKRIWRLEYLIRVARYFSCRTSLRPPMELMGGKKLKKTDGVWHDADEND